jgi:hypothetical protein
VRLTVVAACLFAAAAQADFFDEPVPGAVAPPTAPTTTTLDGVRMTMVTAVSKKSADELKAHYTAVFQRTGLYMADEVKDLDIGNNKQVTALDADRMLSYTVVFQPGKGTTTVILSIAELARPPKPIAQSFAPVMPGATEVSAAQLEQMETMSYSVPATPHDIKVFYREQLKKMGYVEQGQDLLFTKGGETISLMVSPGLQPRGVMLIHERPGVAAVQAMQEAMKEPVKAPARDGGR